MRKSVKVILIIASILVGIGILCLCLSVALGGVDLIFKPSGSLNYQVMTATFDEVEVLEINDVSNDVKLVKSASDEVKITYANSENFGYYLKQIDDTLFIEYDDFREWYEFIGIFSLRNYDLTIELPEKTLEKLTVKTVSGDIEAKEILAETTSLESASGSITAGGNAGELSVSSVSGNIHLGTATAAENVKISATSGDLWLSGDFNGDLSASTMSGEITLKGVAAKNTDVSTTSGDIEARAVQLASTEFDSMSGDVEFNDVICAENMTVDTTSGDIELEKVDAENYYLSSTSGEIDAKILTAKIFNAKSTSGSIDIPQNTASAKGYFNAETTSGDIEVKIVNQ